MFRTFTRTCYSPQELDQFLNSIASDGYQPWIYREAHRTNWRYGQWNYVLDVCVTAFQIQIAPKALPEVVGPDGCKFHQS